MTHVLFLLSGDPRTSPRPAEAIRIAAGVSTWQTIALTFYLSGPAVLALSEFPDEFVDADNYTRYLPVLYENVGAVYVEQNQPLLTELGENPFRYESIPVSRLAEFSANHDYLTRFT